MEGDIVSAGNFVAALLEHAGFLTQSRILESFKDFFRDAGAFVYFIGAVGGLISLVMFGSFRAARYLIIGPAFYWFLVGPTTISEGVVTKLGGGSPRGLPGNVGLASAKEDRDKSLNKAGEEAKDSFNISYAYWLFVKPIDDFVEEFVNVMLKDEDGSDLAVASKVRGLEMIARSLPVTADSIGMLEGELLVQCMESYASAMGAAQNYVKNSITQGISAKSAPSQRQKNNENYSRANDDFIKYAKDKKFHINTTQSPIMYKYIVAAHENKNSESKILNELWNDQTNTPVQIIECGKAWDVLLEQIWFLSATRMPSILRLATGENFSKEEQEKACKELTRKIYDDEPGGVGANNANSGECDLRPGIALATIWNHMSRRDTFQRVADRHSNFNDPLNPTAKPQLGAISSLHHGAKRLAILVGDTIGSRITGIGSIVTTVDLGLSTMRKDGGTDMIIEEAPATQLNVMPGISSLEEVDLPIYEMTRARQQIFTFAQQLPYYQGLIMYLISVAYPFLALVVLLPGRAETFLNVPLAWLWVKSWDIGFAAVILLERVMYNLLPNWSVHPSLRTGPWTHDKLPLVLGEGYNFSHVQGVAYHYVVLSMAMISVPAIMALMTIKAKKAIVSNFTEASSSQARDAGNRAAAEYSIVASTERAELLGRLSGFAKQSPALGAGGLEGGVKSAAGFGMAQLSMSTKALSQLGAGLKDNSKNPVQILSQAVGAATATGLDTYSKMVGYNANLESQYRAAFDDVYGRFGILQMHYDAAAAALDGAGARVSGGFETNRPKENAISAFNKVSEGQLDMLVQTAADVGRFEGAIISGIAGNLIKGAANGLTESSKSISDSIGLPNLMLQVGAFGALNSGNKDAFYKAAADSILDSIESKLEQSAVGYDKAVTWARNFGTNPESFTDSAINEFLNSEESKQGFAGQLLRGVYERGNRLLKESEFIESVPGGVSGQDGLLMSFGGDRRVIRDTSEQDLANGIKLDLNYKNLLDTTQDALVGNRFSSLLGIKLPSETFIEAQMNSELLQKKDDPISHTRRLTEALSITGALESLRGEYESEKAEDRVRELVARAREVEERDKQKGFAIKLASFLDDNFISSAPISALEVINRWQLERENAATNAIISQEMEGLPVLTQPRQLIIRNPRFGDGSE